MFDPFTDFYEEPIYVTNIWVILAFPEATCSGFLPSTISGNNPMS